MRAKHRLLLCCSLVMLAAVTAGPASPAKASSTGQSASTGQRWRLADDFLLSPNQQNPNPDRYGSPNVWRFLKGTTLHDPSSYSRLGKFIPNAFGIDGLEFWRGPFFVPNNLPGVGINASGSDQAPLGWNWPAHTILVHPYDQVPAIVDWHSPITGTVRITITVSDLDPQCGDGIRWFVDRGTATVASGSILNGDVSQSASRSASVHVGSDIYVLVDDGGAGHTIGCDSTGLLLSIHT